MTKNEDIQAQQALWDGPAGGSGHATPRVTPPRSDRRSTRPTERVEASDLWTIDQVAGYLGVPKQTIYCWRTTGYGPQGFRVGKHLRWRAATVFAWTADLERKQ